MLNFIPHGLLGGLGLGALFSLWMLRGGEPGWWSSFPLDKKNFDNQVVSM